MFLKNIFQLSILLNFRFVPDKEFSGTDRNMQRSGPVQFERDEDPFGLDQFLTQAKRASKRKDGPSASSSSNDRSNEKDKRKRRD